MSYRSCQDLIGRNLFVLCLVQCYLQLVFSRILRILPVLSIKILGIILSVLYYSFLYLLFSFSFHNVFEHFLMELGILPHTLQWQLPPPEPQVNYKVFEGRDLEKCMYHSVQGNSGHKADNNNYYSYIIQCLFCARHWANHNVD